MDYSFHLSNYYVVQTEELSPLHLRHDTKEVASPDLLDVALGVVAGEELTSEVDELGGVG